MTAMKILHWTWFRTITQLRDHTFMTSTKNNHFFDSSLHHLHRLKWAIDLLLKNYSILKHATDFKTPTSSFRVHPINLRSPIASESYLYVNNFCWFCFFTNPTVKIFSPGVHPFFIRVFFWVSFSMLKIFLIWASYYVYSMLEIIECIVKVMH